MNESQQHVTSPEWNSNRSPERVTRADAVGAGWTAGLARVRGALTRHQRVVALGLAVLLGVLVRSLLVLRTDFPLNDGGLFFRMTEELQRSGYRLPAVTGYNGEAIPFGYPPLALYVAGLLDDLTPLGLVDVFRVLPLVITSLTVPAFALLARRLLPSYVAVVAATVAFAVLPRSFIWMLMGGGVTRSFGFLFAILSLHEAHRLYTTRRWRYAWTTLLCASLTVLSHLGTAPLVAYTIALLFLVYGRHRHGVASSAVVAAGTVLLTAPWWGTVLRMHGSGPLLAASATGGSIFSDAWVRYDTKQMLLRLAIGTTSEPWFPVILALALAGALVALRRRMVLVPVWWLTIILLDPRTRMTYTMLPVAMLAGLAVSELLLPVLAGIRPERAAIARDGSAAVQALRPPDVPGDRWARLFPVAALTVLLGYTALGAVITRPDLAGETQVLRSLTAADRAAMRWVREQTPPTSRFALVTGLGPFWANDRWSEWFPVLAERRSVGTVQGTEWLARGTFAARVESAAALQECRGAAVDCVERWARDQNATFSHVYIPKTADAAAQCCRPLLAALRADPRYVPVYDGPGAVVFAAPLPVAAR
jgi:hypothetical protein